MVRDPRRGNLQKTISGNFTTLTTSAIKIRVNASKTRRSSGAQTRRLDQVEAWKKSRDLCKETFLALGNKPSPHLVQFAGNLRSASVSILSYISDAWEHRTSAKCEQFLLKALGCLADFREEVQLALTEEAWNPIAMARVSKKAAQTDEALNRFVRLHRRGRFKADGSRFSRARTSAIP